MDIADITVIGSGAAATTTLIEFFTKLIEDPFLGKKIKIMVIEKYPEFWKGIPYGSRSSVNSLTITAISDFISSGEEKDLFLAWLKKNQNQWASYYRENGGFAAEKWLEKNLVLIENNDWQAVYLPRFVFGIYMQNKMHALLKIVEEKGLVQLTLIQAEAVDVRLYGTLYEVILEDPKKKCSVILTNKLVIAIGSAPVRNNVDNVLNREYIYINELYEPLLDGNLETLKRTFIETQYVEERNLLIIGSNASSIELMYLLNHRPDILDVINKVITISKSGKMPCCISTKRFNKYPCKNLDRVKEHSNYDIHTLIEAAKKDIQLAAVQDEIIIPFVDRVVEYTIELMQILDEDSKKMFFGIYGPQLSRLIRRSGPAYKSASESLIEAKKLQLLKGKFLNIEPTSQGGVLSYVDLNNQSQTYHIPFRVVINCSGSDNLKNSSSRLIYNLVRNNICKVNLSEKGFLVNEKFEAAPNLYIMGPLLGGNMNKLIHFWHLENVARLLYLSPYLAEILLSE